MTARPKGGPVKNLSESTAFRGYDQRDEIALFAAEFALLPVELYEHLGRAADPGDLPDGVLDQLTLADVAWLRGIEGWAS
jgi:hypothetical protein